MNVPTLKNPKALVNIGITMNIKIILTIKILSQIFFKINSIL